jgi:hypothetical protein
MRKCSFLLAAAAVLAPAAAAAQAVLPALPAPTITMPTIPSTGCPAYPSLLTSPIARVIVNGVCFDMSSLITVTVPNKIWRLSMTSPIQVGGGRVQVSNVEFNADPYIRFAETTINLPDEANDYAFLFATPVEPGFYTSASSDGRVSITSGVSGSASVAAMPNLQATFIRGFGTVGNLGTDLGVDLGTAACTAGPGLPGSANACDYGTRTNSFGATFFNNLEAQLAYRQTGVGSVVTFTGSVNLNPAQTTPPSTVIPEPATVALVGTGLAGLLLVGRRRRRAQG